MLKKILIIGLCVAVTCGAVVGVATVTSSAGGVEEPHLALAAPVLSFDDGVVSWQPVPHARRYVVTQNDEIVQERSSTRYKIPMCDAEDIKIRVVAVSSLDTHDDGTSEILPLKRLAIHVGGAGVRIITITEIKNGYECEHECEDECEDICTHECETEEVDYIIWNTLENASKYTLAVTHLNTKTEETFTNDNADEDGLIWFKVDEDVTDISVLAEVKGDAENILPANATSVNLAVHDGGQLEAPEIKRTGFLKATWNDVKAESYSIFLNGAFSHTVSKNAQREFMQTSTLANDLKVTVVANALRLRNNSEVSNIATITKFDELDFFNEAYNTASNYGALEMFSYGRATSRALIVDGPTVQARGHTIVNFENNAISKLYGATFSKGHGGISGAADATQLREWYFDGANLTARSEGGNTNWADGSSNEATVLPGRSGSQNWNTVKSVISSHNRVWEGFRDSFVGAVKQNQLSYLAYNVNNAFNGFSKDQFLNPQIITNVENFGNVNWRTNAPTPTGADSDRGKLFHRPDGSFEFSIVMRGNDTGNRANIEWSGNVQMTAGYAHSIITFVIDSDMRFVRYHAFDQYNVTTLSARTNVAATMNFVYHEKNINLNNHVTFRPAYNWSGSNVCDCTDCETNIINGGIVATNSRYEINLAWINDANAASRIRI